MDIINYIINGKTMQVMKILKILLKIQILLYFIKVKQQIIILLKNQKLILKCSLLEIMNGNY